MELPPSQPESGLRGRGCCEQGAHHEGSMQAARERLLQRSHLLDPQGRPAGGARSQRPDGH